MTTNAEETSIALSQGAFTVDPESELKRFGKRLLRDKVGMISLVLVLSLILFAFAGPVLYDVDPNVMSKDGKFLGISMAHPLGTDQIARDTFARLMQGGRVSFAAAGGAGFFALAVGFPLGLLAGYRGGWIDQFIMRFMDTLYAFPGILLALGLVAALGSGLDKIIFAIGIFGVPSLARLTRAQVLSVREMDYVTASRALGASPYRIVAQHVAPNVVSPPLIAVTTLMAAAAIIEASLGFLGVGIAPPQATWGRMLLEAFPTMQIALMQTLTPGIAIFLLVVGMNMFGDTVRDLRDPRLRNS